MRQKFLELPEDIQKSWNTKAKAATASKREQVATDVEEHANRLGMRRDFASKGLGLSSMYEPLREEVAADAIKKELNCAAVPGAGQCWSHYREKALKEHYIEDQGERCSKHNMKY